MPLMITAASSFAFPSFETLRFATLLRMRWKASYRQSTHKLLGASRRIQMRGARRHQIVEGGERVGSQDVMELGDAHGLVDAAHAGRRATVDIGRHALH